MSTVASTAVSLSQTYYLKQFYKNNRSACKASTRKEMSDTELSHEDAMALHQAAKKLLSYDYSDSSNGSNIANTILAYVDTYNNALSTAEGSDDSDVKRCGKQLKSLAKKYSSKLDDIGITIKSDGTMDVNKNLLSSAKLKKVKEAFDRDSGFMETTLHYARKLENKSYQTIYAQLTGSGQSVNIGL